MRPLSASSPERPQLSQDNAYKFPGSETFVATMDARKLASYLYIYSILIQEYKRDKAL